MKKTYRLTIDYEIEINEKVKADGDYSLELVKKTQHIMNAFFLCPEILLEYNKERFYEGFLDFAPWGIDLGELLEIKDQDEYMKSLTRHLPANTVPYFQALFCDIEGNSSIEAYSNEGMGLCIEQFSKPIPIHASFPMAAQIGEKTEPVYQKSERYGYPGGSRSLPHRAFLLQSGEIFGYFR